MKKIISKYNYIQDTVLYINLILIIFIEKKLKQNIKNHS